MNGSTLTLSLVGALALGAVLGKRGSRATAPFVSQHGPYTITVMFQPESPGKHASGRAEATLNGSEIGEVVFEEYGRLCQVQWSSVDKDHRRQGLASAMYDAIERATGLPLTSGDISSSLGALGLWIKRGKLTREQALERYGEWVLQDEAFSEGSAPYEQVMAEARRALRGSRATDPTSTPAFRRWFGESKVVDGAGRPLVVFHGTTAGDFDAFRPNYRKGEQLGFGIHFAADREFAAKYAEDPTVARKGKTPKVYAVYLSIQRPLVADAIVYEGTPEFALAKKLAGSKLYTDRGEDEVRLTYMQRAIDQTSAQRAEKLIREAGYDGILYESVLSSSVWTGGGMGRKRTGSSRSYIVFSPTQIKSATGNRGTFDPADPRISFNRSTR